MISPTPGRIVWFRPNGFYDSINHYNIGEPLAAMIVHVWNDRMVNIVLFDSSGMSYPFTSVHLRQPEDPVPVGTGYAEWMPYQVGQAKPADVVTGAGSVP